MAATATLNFCLMATTPSLNRYCMHKVTGTKFDVEIKIRGISIEIIK